MARPASSAYLCWILAILLHADVIMILALSLGGEEVEDEAEEAPHLQCRLVQPRPVVQVELRRDSRTGCWPLKCDHRNRTLEIADDRLGDGLRCNSCGWPWWVIRAWPQD